MGGGRRNGASKQMKGEDLRIEMSLTLQEIADGVQKTIKINIKEACTHCKGTGSKDNKMHNCTQCGGMGQVRRVTQSLFGHVQTVVTCPSCRGEGKTIQNKCTYCSGEGRMSQAKNVDVDIPRGVHEGQYVRIRGEGNAAPRGGIKGDILILIHEKEDNILRRDGANLFIEFPLTFTQVALGDEVMVPAINKKIKLKIPPGTQTGKVFKISGQGLPQVNSSYIGDLYVVARVVTPTHLNADEVRILEQFKTHDQKRDLKLEKSFVDKLKDFFK